MVYIYYAKARLDNRMPGDEITKEEYDIWIKMYDTPHVERKLVRDEPIKVEEKVVEEEEKPKPKRRFGRRGRVKKK